MRIRRPLAHPLNLGELQAQVSILCLNKGHPLLQRGHVCWTIAASVAGSSCAAAAAMAKGVSRTIKNISLAL